MIGYLNQHLEEVNQKIKSVDNQNWKVVLKHHRETIKFMQHERLIHLLVMLAVAINFLVAMLFTLNQPSLVLFVIDGLLLFLLVPYIFHYFKLENGVQKLYWIDKLIQNKLKLSGGRD